MPDAANALLTAALLLGSATAAAGELPCANPVALAVREDPAGFEHWSTRHVTVATGPANHRGHDILAARGEGVLLTAKFAYGLVDDDLEEEWVDLYLQERAPCGPWTRVGSVRTSADGQFGTQFGIVDDGGRVFFPLPAERTPAGHSLVRMVARGDGSGTTLSLYTVARGTGVVVFDIDGTLTADDLQVLLEVVGELRARKYAPVVRPGAAAVATAWAARGYLPLYLTGRPDVLHALTREWLAAQGFPAGVVRMTDVVGEVLPTPEGVGAFKTRVLRRWLEDTGIVVAAAYGNAPTDIQAYAAAGVPRERTYIVGPHAGEGGTVALESYETHLAEVQRATP